MQDITTNHSIYRLSKLKFDPTIFDHITKYSNHLFEGNSIHILVNKYGILVHFIINKYTSYSACF